MPAPTVIAVDIPIGLLAIGSRSCDQAARRFLAPTRSSWVFPAPIRPVLDAASHPEASSRRRAIEGKGMSIQAYAITGKVREVDTVLRERVFEVHPEVSFAQMNKSRPLAFSKKGASGRNERMALLSTHFGDAPQRLVAERQKNLVAADDVLDALVALWTAGRITTGEAQSVPSIPDRDPLGLRMAIFY